MTIRVHFELGPDIIFEINKQQQLMAIKLIGLFEALDFSQSIFRGCAPLITIIYQRIFLPGGIDALQVLDEFRRISGPKPFRVISV